MEAKGDCFKINAEHFQKNAVPGWYLCHGIVINSVDHKPMAHCWIEYEKVITYAEPAISDKVIDFSLTYVLDISNGNHYEGSMAWYYLVGGIDHEKVLRYDLVEYIDKVIEQDYYGPWDLVFDR